MKSQMPKATAPWNAWPNSLSVRSWRRGGDFVKLGEQEHIDVVAKPSGKNRSSILVGKKTQRRCQLLDDLLVRSRLCLMGLLRCGHWELWECCRFLDWSDCFLVFCARIFLWRKHSKCIGSKILFLFCHVFFANLSCQYSPEMFFRPSRHAKTEPFYEEINKLLGGTWTLQKDFRRSSAWFCLRYWYFWPVLRAF